MTDQPEQPKWSSKAGYVAYTQSVSMDSIAKSAAILDKELGVDALVLPQYREPDYDMAHKLEAIAQWLEKVIEVLYPAPVPEPEEEDTEDAEPVDLEALTVKELKALAEEQEIDLPARVNKSDIIDLLSGDQKVE